MAVSKAVLDKYEMVIGLEVHVELKTKTKIFCSCPTDFGAEPNMNCCPGCLGMPGVLPVLNKKVIEYAVKAGIATNCAVAGRSIEDRKNYFYPDLPKAYQVSQGDFPICEGGHLTVETSAGSKTIGITRIHIEEDAGKLVHLEGEGTLIDGNRGGTPLVEIVSEPDIRSAEEAKEYLQKLRGLMRYIDVSDCKMNEGSFRCDVNLSVRKKGESKLGVRAEMKNLNSFQFVVKAIEHEFARQVEAVEAGDTLVQETRRFDAVSGKTYSMRTKANADDYRYFPDPDLPPVIVSDEYKAEILKTIPVLPEVRKRAYVEKYQLSDYAADRLTLDREVADYFEKVASISKYPVNAANLLINDIITQIEGEDIVIDIEPEKVAAIADMLGDEKINSGTGRKLAAMLFTDERRPEEIVAELGLEQISDLELLREMARKVVAENEDSVIKYREGKLGALQALVGQMMKLTAGKGNPRLIQQVLKELV